jgi:acyl-CoA reductase-like NAD-dependent aldehyde dehydrogenase
VHEDVADEFIKILSGLINDRKASSNPEGFTDWRGLYSKVSADRVSGLISDAIDKGAKVAIGRQHTDYNVVQPIVLENVTPEMKIYTEEIFGPALTLERFKTNEEAIEKANRTEYGLAASIYGANEAECFAIASEIESGQVHINGATVQ